MQVYAWVARSVDQTLSPAQISTMDINKIPSDGILHAIIAQFSPADWSLVALQVASPPKST